MSWRQRYEDYLASPRWQVKRAQVMHRSKGVCENCGTATARMVHHLTYENLGKEPLVDLLAVCQPCHDDLHLQSQARNIPRLSADDLHTLIHEAFTGLLDARLAETRGEGADIDRVMHDLQWFANIDCAYFADLLRDQARIIATLRLYGWKPDPEYVAHLRHLINDEAFEQLTARDHAIAEQVMPEFQVMP